jgi:hypothetical protein
MKKYFGDTNRVVIYYKQESKDEAAPSQSKNPGGAK